VSVANRPKAYGSRSISPKSPLLAAYFTGLLCRNPTLSPQGRTLTAVVIGLGDEDVGEYDTMRFS
jgi:hypothetical protein